MATTKFFYLRNTTLNQPYVGCIAYRSYGSGDGRQVYFSVSTCSDKDLFNKEIARKIAEGRLDAKIQVGLNIKGIKNIDAMRAIVSFIANKKSDNIVSVVESSLSEDNKLKFARRAQIAAKKWLKAK